MPREAASEVPKMTNVHDPFFFPSSYVFCPLPLPLSLLLAPFLTDVIVIRQNLIKFGWNHPILINPIWLRFSHNHNMHQVQLILTIWPYFWKAWFKHHYIYSMTQQSPTCFFSTSPGTFSLTETFSCSISVIMVINLNNIVWTKLHLGCYLKPSFQ